MARLAKKVILSDAEKVELTTIIKQGTHKSRTITRARTLLLLDAGKDKAAIEAALGIGRNQYYQIKRRYIASGLPGALYELPRSGQPALLTPLLEAQITSLACSDSPEGSACWTLTLLKEKTVELAYVEKISTESVRKVLKKVSLSLG